MFVNIWAFLITNTCYIQIDIHRQWTTIRYHRKHGITSSQKGIIHRYISPLTRMKCTFNFNFLVWYAPFEVELWIKLHRPSFDLASQATITIIDFLHFLPSPIKLLNLAQACEHIFIIFYHNSSWQLLHTGVSYIWLKVTCSFAMIRDNSIP